MYYNISHLGPHNAEDIVEKYPGEGRAIPGAVLPNVGQTRVGKKNSWIPYAAWLREIPPDSPLGTYVHVQGRA